MSCVVIGKKWIYKPFEEKQLKKLNIKELLQLATNYKRGGLKATLITHLTTYRSDKRTKVDMNTYNHD